MIRAQMQSRRFLMSIVVGSLTVCGSGAEDANDSSWFKFPPIEMHGFYEMRAGYRTRKDKFAKDMSIMESRFQFDLYS